MSGLQGKYVLNTRAAHQAARLDDLLCEYGAIPVAYPCLAIGLPEDVAALDRTITQALSGHFDWLVLTSTNTVLALADRLEALNAAPTALAMVTGLQVAAVGPKTAARAAEELGLTVDVLPEEYVAESLAVALEVQPGMSDAVVWLPQSAIAQPDLGMSLQKIARQVVQVAAYQTETAEGGERLQPWLPRLDALTFTSGSTVRNFLERSATEGIEQVTLQGKVVACIGPKTARVARTKGLNVQVIPNPHTLEAMVAALAGYFEARAAD